VVLPYIMIDITFFLSLILMCCNIFLRLIHNFEHIIIYKDEFWTLINQPLKEAMYNFLLKLTA